MGKTLECFSLISRKNGCTSFLLKARTEIQQDHEAGYEAAIDTASQIDTLMAELEVIVRSIEADLEAGRATDRESANRLHRLRLRAEELFRDV